MTADTEIEIWFVAAVEARRVARELLLAQLSSRLGMPADRVRLRRTASGKPCLADASDLRFSVSHSHGVAAVALARGREVGVDVEAIDPALDVDVVIRRFFPAEEAKTLLQLSRQDRCAAFFRSWARKEAFAKADGAGLRRPLRELRAPVDGGPRPSPVPGRRAGWWPTSRRRPATRPRWPQRARAGARSCTRTSPLDRVYHRAALALGMCPSRPAGTTRPMEVPCTR